MGTMLCARTQAAIWWKSGGGQLVSGEGGKIRRVRPPFSAVRTMATMARVNKQLGAATKAKNRSARINPVVHVRTSPATYCPVCTTPAVTAEPRRGLSSIADAAEPMPLPMPSPSTGRVETRASSVPPGSAWPFPAPTSHIRDFLRGQHVPLFCRVRLSTAQDLRGKKKNPIAIYIF